MEYLRKNMDVSAYLVIGPENTKGRPVEDVVRAALRAGFTCVQIRSKTASAREMIALARSVAKVREEMGLSGEKNRTNIAARNWTGSERLGQEKSDRNRAVPILVDDRLDVVLAAREQGIPIDGIHVGQKDIPPEVCRKYLGPSSVVGLSAPMEDLLDYARYIDSSVVDYFGAGPLHPTESKPDAGLLHDGTHVTRTLSGLAELCQVSPIPVIVGGGVKAGDIPDIKKTGAAGFFVISAVAAASHPYNAARELVNAWKA